MTRKYGGDNVGVLVQIANLIGSQFRYSRKEMEHLRMNIFLNIFVQHKKT